MALWHYKFYLVPKDTNEPINKIVSEEGFIPEIEEDWSLYKTGNQLLGLIENVLPPTESWSDSILMYGSVDDRIEIGILENTKEIEYVCGRFDLTKESWKIFIHDVVKIAEILNLKIYDHYSFCIFYPTIENIISSIKNSNAHRFLTDPDEFFNSFKQK